MVSRLINFRISLILQTGVPWSQLWKGGEIGYKAYFGHDPSQSIQLLKFATGLDTGCVYGNSLSCVTLPSDTIYSVKSNKSYYQSKKPQSLFH